MLYVWLRLIIAILICGTLIILNMKFSAPQKRLRRNILCIILGIVVYLVFIFVPIEDMAVKFESPIDAFEYQVGEDNIVKVVEGEESAVIVYLNDNNGPGYYITKKSDDGWMLENSFDIFIHGFNSKSISAGNIFNCFSERAPGTNECFIFVSEGFMEEKVEYSESDVKDSQGSTFEQFPIHINNYTLVVHYAVVQSNDPDYEVIINRERVKIEI